MAKETAEREATRLFRELGEANRRYDQLEQSLRLTSTRAQEVLTQNDELTRRNLRLKYELAKIKEEFPEVAEATSGVGWPE